jgi:hypothetical protein
VDSFVAVGRFTEPVLTEKLRREDRPPAGQRCAGYLRLGLWVLERPWRGPRTNGRMGTVGCVFEGWRTP